MATLAELRNGIREQSSTVNSGNITDAWLTIVVNSAISEVYDIIVAAFEHYFVSSHSFSLTSANTLDLSALTGGFYKDVGLDYLPNGVTNPTTVHKIDSFIGRNRYGNQNFSGSYRLFYTPNVTLLVADGDELPTEMLRWRELIDIAGARRVLAKREMQHPELIKRFAEVRDRIVGLVKQRMAEPALIPLHGIGTDQYGDSDYVRRYYITGTTLTVYGGREV